MRWPHSLALWLCLLAGCVSVPAGYEHVDGELTAECGYRWVVSVRHARPERLELELDRALATEHGAFDFSVK